MSSQETIVCGKEENQRKSHISEQDGKSHIPLTEDKARIAEAARQSALEILRDALKKKDRVLMETPRDLISCDSERPQFWMERFGVLTEQRVRDLISVLEAAKFMGDPSREKTRAYVYTESGDRTIYLYPPFWKGPSYLRKKWQWGTLIHEASHFLGADDITYEPVRISVACKGLIVKNSSTDPNSLDYVPLANAMVNASNIQYEFELTLRHGGYYIWGRYSCCGETARNSVCERAVPDEFLTSPNNGSKLEARNIDEILRDELLRARDRLKKHIADLRATADAVDKANREATKATGAGKAAALTSVASALLGVGLAPFTFGASLAASFTGLGVLTAGTVTSKAATTRAMKQSLDKQEEFLKLLRQCLDEVRLIRRYMQLLSVQVQETTSSHVTHVATTSHVPTSVRLDPDIFSTVMNYLELKDTKSELAAKMREAAAKLEEVIEQVNKMQETLTE
ncbi:uncharacterized protein LOC112548545 [Alligator sinensis]|uniref:Uncharacterized protein LOC112548545 n=1 Tax=Alligator sinensis TaxID=38654 RepID=A0A3Q0FW83_ALLSI|nr:uncharacterized protein LOC112548545 [Alligator sinensis]